VPEIIKNTVVLVMLVSSIGLGLKSCWHNRWVVSPPVTGSPIQEPLPSSMPFEYKGYTLTPVASFSIKAKLLSSEEYHSDEGAKLSPIDYALGWDKMSQDEIIEQLGIAQDHRFFTYRWEKEPPIPPQEIIESATNIHLIPANPEIEKQLKAARRGEHVKLMGQLVDVHGDKGFIWKSSRSRQDTGKGACELMWVESVDISRS